MRKRTGCRCGTKYRRVNGSPHADEQPSCQHRLVHLDGLGDLVAGGVNRGERRHRILEHRPIASKPGHRVVGKLTVRYPSQARPRTCAYSATGTIPASPLRTYLNPIRPPSRPPRGLDAVADPRTAVTGSPSVLVTAVGHLEQGLIAHHGARICWLGQRVAHHRSGWRTPESTGYWRETEHHGTRSRMRCRLASGCLATHPAVEYETKEAQRFRPGWRLT